MQNMQINMKKIVHCPYSAYFYIFCILLHAKYAEYDKGIFCILICIFFLHIATYIPMYPAAAYSCTFFSNSAYICKIW